MAIHLEGKLFLLFFLFLLASPHASRVFVNSNSVSIEDENENKNDPHVEPKTESSSYSDQQLLLLQKLDEIVRNLSEIVSRLESKISEPSKEPFSNKKGKIKEAKEEASEGRIPEEKERARTASVAKYSPFWSEKFQFVSAVKLDSVATCINVLPFRDYEGQSKYVAVGDDKGRLYVFLKNGDVAVEYQTTSDSPITAIVSYLSVYKNESFVVTGHKNGAIFMHRVWEGSSSEEWSSLLMEYVGEFVSDNNGSEITILDVHHLGRIRYILATDVDGKISVFTEKGAVYGSIRPSSKPLAFLKQRLLFLTETGAGSLDLRSMKVRESGCEGLNHSRAQNYVFDAIERSKAYGFTSEGDLIHVLLLGDIMNFKCRVRSKKKSDMVEPLAFQAIKGYLLIVSEDKVFVFNVSTQHYVRVGAPRSIFSAGLDEIRSSFLNYQTGDVDAETRQTIPLIASDREKLIVLGLGGGYVGMYRSNLPVFKGESNTVLWTSPVLFFILFLFGAWHFFAQKKDALTSWGPDDPFSSTTPTAAAPLGGTSTASGERSFIDPSSRNPDMMDLRSGGLRGPSRRYVSPPRYSGGTTNSYRPASTEHNSRPASVDPNFRAPSELKFRGSTLEPSGFSKRRDLFVNNQGVDESS
ncbi:uncharacterized membrane protein At1g75140 [Ziziphus jujuba]|uniref:Uncharacterized membrane protein At1g75140 n=1 Tax=Ziziphus jujuba TaxID=326968 RepID=A0A6P3ZWI9_ZIZJJ|nr:uncharacterized membrane protein At1g75140 [Ziziphus jujuba]